MPVATPWLIMLSRVGVVFLTARGFAADTALVTAALGAGTVMCAALGSSWLRRGRERISEPGADRAQREAAAAGAGGRTRGKPKTGNSPVSPNTTSLAIPMVVTVSTTIAYAR